MDKLVLSRFKKLSLPDVSLRKTIYLNKKKRYFEWFRNLVIKSTYYKLKKYHNIW